MLHRYPPLPRFLEMVLSRLVLAFTVAYFFNAMARIQPRRRILPPRHRIAVCACTQSRKFPMNMYGSLSQGIEIVSDGLRLQPPLVSRALTTHSCCRSLSAFSASDASANRLPPWERDARVRRSDHRNRWNHRVCRCSCPRRFSSSSSTLFRSGTRSVERLCWLS